MSSGQIGLLDTVALTNPLPFHGLSSGEVGTVVETLAPDVFEVEFSDAEGQTYTSLAIKQNQLERLTRKNQ
jgi:hypothetical protein